jgi:hypothetical protein
LNDTIIWSTFVDESSLEAAENNAL